MRVKLKVVAAAVLIAVLVAGGAAAEYSSRLGREEIVIYNGCAAVIGEAVITETITANDVRYLYSFLLNGKRTVKKFIFTEEAPKAVIDAVKKYFPGAAMSFPEGQAGEGIYSYGQEFSVGGFTAVVKRAGYVIITKGDIKIALLGRPGSFADRYAKDSKLLVVWRNATARPNIEVKALIFEDAEAADGDITYEYLDNVSIFVGKDEVKVVKSW